MKVVYKLYSLWTRSGPQHTFLSENNYILEIIYKTMPFEKLFIRKRQASHLIFKRYYIGKFQNILGYIKIQRLKNI